MTIETENYNEVLKNLNNYQKRFTQILDFATYARNLLTKRERDIVYFRHLHKKTYEECGKRWGLSRERIRQIEGKCHEILKNIKIS